jgi:hypothetical protein
LIEATRFHHLDMARNPDSTVPSRAVPAVVIVSLGEAMLARWRELLFGLDEVPSIQTTDLSRVATVVAQWRPFAILIERDVFEFDEDEFRELARDVNAELITVDAEASKQEIAARSIPKLRAALGRWRGRHVATP